MRTEDQIRISDVLRPYQNRLRLQSLINACFCGAAGGSVIGFGWLMVRHLFCQHAAARSVDFAFAAVGMLVTTAVVWVLTRPNLRTTAAKLDTLVAEDRVSTMVAFADEEGYFYQLQRVDTVERLRDVSPSSIRITFPVLLLAIAMVMAVLCVCSSFLPYGILRRSLPAESTEVAKKNDEIGDMIAALQQKIDGSNLSDDRKQAMMERLQQLTEEMEGETSVVRLMALMNQVQMEFETELEAIEEYTSVIQRMLRYSIFQPLCEAILSRNGDKVHLACWALSDHLIALTGETRTNALLDMYGYITAILKEIQPTDIDYYL